MSTLEIAVMVAGWVALGCVVAWGSSPRRHAEPPQRRELEILHHPLGLFERLPSGVPAAGEVPLATFATREQAEAGYAAAVAEAPARPVQLASVQPVVRHRFLNWIGDPPGSPRTDEQRGGGT